MPLRLRREDDLADRLGGAWLTTELSRELRARLGKIGRLASVPPATTLTREGEVTATCSIVLAGRVALRTRVPERGVVTILTVEPGDIVGWSAIVFPYRATSTAVTLVQTELATFDGPTLRAQLERDQGLAAAFYPLVLRALSRRLVGTRLQLLDLFSQDWAEPR